MILSIGSDHGGFPLKVEICGRLREEGHEVIDEGCPSPDPVDYPEIAFSVADDVVKGRADLGILICGTGIGMSNASSRVNGIVAALCTNSFMARMSRLHNDANVLCLGGRVVGDELAWDIVKTFIENVPLTNEKYIRRRGKVSSYTNGEA